MKYITLERSVSNILYDSDNLFIPYGALIENMEFYCFKEIRTSLTYTETLDEILIYCIDNHITTIDDLNCVIELINSSNAENLVIAINILVTIVGIKENIN